MRISGGRLHLRVTEQLPDHRVALAQGQRPRSISVANIDNDPIANNILANVVDGNRKWH